MSASRAACPVCLGDELNVFLERQSVPVLENVLFKYRKDALNIERGDLRMVACSRCSFVFNTDFNAALAQYGEGYDNNQTCSAEFTTHLESRIERIAQAIAPGSTIVEIGSGSGWFLEHLLPRVDGSRGYGFDPAYGGPEEALDGRIRYQRRYFAESDAALRPDVVICRHVIEHVAEPVELLSAARKAVESSHQARVFFETPCVEWILGNQVIWDFFYEHCSYFSQASLRTAFARAGFEVDRIDRVFGGQYLWVEAVPARSPAQSLTFSNGVVPTALKFKEAFDQLVALRKAEAGHLRARGNLAVWGAGAKGATFLNLVDPAANLIDCVIDIDPRKQERFVGGTGHQVVGVPEIAQREIVTAFLMNPNYREENRKLLAQSGVTVELID
jgi:Methyltransferase domain/C-methyltransferase C-terminal domain